MSSAIPAVYGASSASITQSVPPRLWSVTSASTLGLSTPPGTVVSISDRALSQSARSIVSETLTVSSIELAEGEFSSSRAGKLVLRFNENIDKGLGLIRLKDANGKVLEDISVGTSSKVRVEGSVLTVELSRTLDYNARYTVSFAEGTVTSQDGEKFRGAVYGFRTERDLTGPDLRTGFGLQGLSRHAQVVMHFNEDVKFGSGLIHMRNAAGDILESFDVSSSDRVRVVGNALIISPTEMREYSTLYSLSMGAGVIKDLAGNDFRGVDQFTFGTGADKDAPVIQRFTPMNGEGRVSTRTNIVLRFDEEIQRGAGQIQLKDAGGRVVESFDAATSDRLRRSGSACLNSFTPRDKDRAGGLKWCRVVQGGVRRLRRTQSRGGQLGAHQGYSF